MNTTITLEARSAYGIWRYYPTCEQTRVLALLAKAKTFTRADLELLRDAGFTVLTVGQMPPAD